MAGFLLQDSWTSGFQPSLIQSNDARTSEDKGAIIPSYTWSLLMNVLQKGNFLPRQVNFLILGDPIGRGSYFDVTRLIIPDGLDHFQYFSSVPNTTEPGDVVAIKRVKRELLPSSSGEVGIAKCLEPVVQEVRVLARRSLQRNENIARLLTVIWEDKADRELIWPSLVMEYYPCTLAELQHTVEAPLLFTEKIETMAGIAMGLEALHQEDICHGDLKSENILVQITKEGKKIPKLADFSSSICLRDYSEEDTVKIGGTFWWRAPELLKNDGQAPPSLALASDYYSFGLLYWRVIVCDGKNPFQELGLVLDGPHEEQQKLQMAVQTLKEHDCVRPLFLEALRGLFASVNVSPSEGFCRYLAALLHPNPNIRVEEVKAFLTSNPEVLKLFTAKFEAMNLEASKAVTPLAYVDDFRENMTSAYGTVDDMIERNSQRFSTLDILGLIIAEANNLTRSPGDETKRLIFEELLASGASWTMTPKSRCERCCRVASLETENASNKQNFENLMAEVFASNLSEHTCNTENKGYTTITMNNLPIQAFAFNILALFVCYVEGYGVQSDYHEAIGWLVKGARAGMTHLGAVLPWICQKLGVSLPKDLPYKTWTIASVLMGEKAIAQESLRLIDSAASKVVEAMRSKWYDGISFHSSNYYLPSVDIGSNQDTNTVAEPNKWLQVKSIVGQIQEGLVNDEMADEQGYSFMHFLCGHWLEPIEAVRELLARYPNLLNAPAENGATPVLVACRAGRLNIVQFLVNFGADLSSPMLDNRSTPLHWLVLHEEASDVIRILIAAGADVHAQSVIPCFEHFERCPVYPHHAGRFIGTPLHWATASGFLSNVRCLIESGTPLYTEGPTRKTPLELAVEMRRHDIVEYMLLHTHPSCQLPSELFNNLTSHETLVHEFLGMYSRADEEKTTDILVRFCIEHDLSYFDKAILPLIERAITVWPLERIKRLFQQIKQAFSEYYLAHGIKSRRPDDLVVFNCLDMAHIFSPNRFVMQRNDSDLLKYLLKEGMSVHKRDADGRGYLHHAASCGSGTDVVRLLLERGVRGDERSNRGLTPLQEAIVHGHIQIAELISAKFTPADLMHQCVISGMETSNPSHMLVAQLIRKSGLNTGALKGLEYLLDRKPFPVNFVLHDELKINILHWAASTFNFYEGEYQLLDSARTLPLLLDRFKAPEYLYAVDTHGRTPMHLAAYYGNSRTVKLLHDAGIDVNLADNYGFTPLDHCHFHVPEDFALLDLPPTRMMVRRWMQGRQHVAADLISWGASFSESVANGSCGEMRAFSDDFEGILDDIVKHINTLRKEKGKKVFEV